MDFVTCTNCGWVHTLISREEAERSVERFNAYFWSLTRSTREECYNNKESSIEDYSHCYGCGAKEPMRWYKNGDCPGGVTIQPTILGPTD